MKFIELIMTWTPWIAVILVLIGLIFWLIGKVNRQLRGHLGAAYFITCTAYGIVVMIYSSILLYAAWGIVGLIICLALFGVGAVPGAIIATLIDGQWEYSLAIVFMASVSFGGRIFGLKLTED